MELLKDSSTEIKGLYCYGKPLFTYQGSGEVILNNNSQISCNFQAGQYSSGNIVILLESDYKSIRQDFNTCTEFRGTSSEGFKLISSGRFHDINYLPELPENPTPGVWTALKANQLDVRNNTNSDVKKLKFLLTNVALPPRPLHPPLPADKVSLMRISNYNEIMSVLQVRKDIEVTAELYCEFSKDIDFESITNSVDSLCAVLSIARGTSVQWVLLEEIDQSGYFVLRRHQARITKNYSGLNLISYSEPKENQCFLNIAFPAYQNEKNSFVLNSRTVSAYLDAKSEADFIEMRSAKLVVAMELLRTALLNAPESKLKLNILDNNFFQELCPKIDKAIREICGPRISKDDKNAICAKIPGLNRRSFANHLRKIIHSLGLPIPASDQSLFIACRNKLVHEGSFYCKAASPEERKSVRPLESTVQEYFFLIHFLDRIFLGLLGYSDMYLDWSSQPPKAKKLKHD